MIGDHRAFGLGAVLSAALAVTGGVVLFRAAARRSAVSLPLGVMGATAVLWGTGQALVGVTALQTPLGVQVQTVGDAVSLAAAPLALAGLLSLPQPVGSTGRRGRVMLDALLIASAGAAVLWHSVFRSAVHGPSHSGIAVVVLLAELSIVALALLLAVASLDRGLLVGSVGMAAFVGGDLLFTHALVSAGGTWPWQAAAAACLGWPLICTGLLLLGGGERGPQRLRRLGPDVRSGLVTALMVVGLAAALVLLRRADGEGLDTVSAVLLVLILSLLGGRGLVHQRQRGVLVRTLLLQARQDFLTGVGNRRALTEHLLELAAAPVPTSVVVVDLDGFKEVNDRLGHAVGDALLVEVAAAMADAMPSGWQVFRPGGDEFALAGEGEEGAAADHARAALEGVRRAGAAVHGVGRVPLSASAGVAQLRQGGGDPLAALSEASTAMQAAKHAGRDQVVVHSGELAARARHRAVLVRRLRDALSREDLTVSLQPIVRMQTGRVTGFEVLSRWDDEQLGAVPPDDFVPVAEETGLVLQLGALVLHRGLAALSSLGGVEQRLRLSVNASPLELRSTSYVQGVQSALRLAGVPAELLTVEVTEAVFVTRDDPAVATLQALADLGVRVAVDDFGTGYSSLSYLGRLPVHAVKIDRSLVAGLGEPRTRRIVEALIAMCRALEMDVIAEGVEEQAQAVVLGDLGVEHGQGWLWSRARPCEELRAAVSG